MKSGPLLEKGKSEGPEGRAASFSGLTEFKRLAGLVGDASGVVAKPSGSLNMLMTIIPGGINRVTDDEWEEVEMTVDSGASETGIGEDMVESAELREGRASRKGTVYEVVNGVRIPNLGEKRIIGTSEEGISRTITTQVCDVNKGLLSVRRMVDAGNRVVFDKSGSYIEDPVT